MAIQYARARYIKRSEGGSAVRQACYNARLAMVSERTGERFDWRRKGHTLEHHEILLPPGCPYAARRFVGAVERRGGGREAEGRAGRARGDPGIAGGSRNHPRAPPRDGARICRTAFCVEGARGADQSAPAASRRDRRRDQQLSRAFADHDAASRGRGVQREKSARSRSAGPQHRRAPGCRRGRAMGRGLARLSERLFRKQRHRDCRRRGSTGAGPTPRREPFPQPRQRARKRRCGDGSRRTPRPRAIRPSCATV